ncbi:MAG: alpha/beta hydrolase, partial [Firmicutes bacterium]|nr:alpha/beta hydrolase [Bacillota bacterium]
VKGWILIVHGLGEHGGRYGHVAEAFNLRGYAAAAFELRGHGRSGGKRGDLPSYEAMMDDIRLVLDGMASSHPGRPGFLYGHSMGGNLVLNFALRRKPALAGVIASSPWLRLAYEPRPLDLLLARALRRLYPSFTKSNGLPAAYLSHDERVAKDYLDDPLVHDRVSVRLYLAMKEAGEWAVAHAPEFPLPLLLMHGDGDRITSFAASAEFSRRMAREHTFKQWSGFYHEPHNETGRTEVLDFVVDWVESTAGFAGE